MKIQDNTADAVNPKRDGWYSRIHCPGWMVKFRDRVTYFVPLDILCTLGTP